MFGIGLSEIILIGLILIVFIRPDDLPRFLRSAGKLYGKAKRTYNELITIKDRIIKEIDEAARLEDSPDRKPPAPALPKPAEAPPPPDQPPAGEAPSLTEPPGA
jgi:Sec-independent protein translocase protein TatA